MTSEVTMKYVFASIAALTLATPAFADEYYVVRETTTKECKVVAERPRETTWVQIGDVSFTTREEADERVKVLCRDVDEPDVVVEPD